MEARGLSRRAIVPLGLGGARVLVYHDVGEHGDGDPRYAVTRTQLAGHLDQIRRGGHPVVPLARVWSGPGGQAAGKRRPVAARGRAHPGLRPGAKRKNGWEPP